MNFIQLRAAAMCAFLTFALTACGGGGSGGSSGGSSNSPPRFTSPTSFTFEENRPIAFLLTVTDPDGDDIIIRDDALGDGHLFLVSVGAGGATVTLNPSSRTLNYEQPEDVNRDNVYEQTITLSDGKATTTAVIQVTITDVDDPPQCTQGAEVDWYENETGLVYTFDGFDEDGPGEYGNLELLRFPHGLWTRENFETAFRLDQATGELFLDQPFDFEEMADYPGIEFSVSYTQANVQVYCSLTVTPVDVPTIVTSGIRLKGVVRSTANMGDIDGDGLDELWVETAIGQDINGTYPEAYVIYGKTLRDAFAQTGAADIELSQLGSAEAVRLYAEFPLSATGVAGGAQETFFTRTVGDVDGDAIPDFLVGVRPGWAAQNSVVNLDRPYAYLVWGSALAASGGTIDLLNITPSQGLVLSGPGSVSRRNLEAASGDFDGDGVPDIVLSLSDIFVSGQGRAPISYVVFGDDIVSSRASGAIRVDTGSQVLRLGQMSGFSGYDRIGQGLLSPGDIDGDGRSDLFATGADMFNGYLPGSVIGTLQRDQTHRFFDYALPLMHPVRSMRFGLQSFDMEGDGMPDLLFSLMSILGETDLAMIVSGPPIASRFPPGVDDVYYLAADPATRILYYEGALGDSDIIGIGDIDGDGLDDIALGVPTRRDFEDGPAVQIVFGKAIANSDSQRIDLRTLAAGEGVLLRGVRRGGVGLVSGMSSVSDIDGDGRMDLVLVAHARGEVYVVPSTDIMSAVNAGRQVIDLEPKFAYEPPR